MTAPAGGLVGGFFLAIVLAALADAQKDSMARTALGLAAVGLGLATVAAAYWLSPALETLLWLPPRTSATMVRF